ncbi:MAG: hypothetical protein U0792_05515 [Gemmataceae bacterium]
MSAAVFEVEFHEMRVGQIPGRFVVAKVARISSPPVAVGSVQDPRLSAIQRLADVLRGGRRTRAYADFLDYMQRVREDPEPEWAGYLAAVCRSLKVDQLAPLRLGPVPEILEAARPEFAVTYHSAEMNDRPYIVARVGPILGGPAAELLMLNPAGSALDRLADVFRAGTGGQCFADHAAGLSETAALDRWEDYQQSVAWELSARAGRGPRREEWLANTSVFNGGQYRYARPSPTDILLPGSILNVGDVVRVITGQTSDPALVRIGDRETGAELGVVDIAALQSV